MGGEDIELMRDILVSGGQGWWVPSARVEHVVSPDRQTIGYLRRYWRGHGAYLGRLEQRGRGEAPLGAGKLVRRAVRAELRYLSHRLMSPPEVWVEELKAASELRGRLAWQRARDRVA